MSPPEERHAKGPTNALEGHNLTTDRGQRVKVVTFPRASLAASMGSLAMNSGWSTTFGSIGSGVRRPTREQRRRDSAIKYKCEREMNGCMEYLGNGSVVFKRELTEYEEWVEQRDTECVQKGGEAWTDEMWINEMGRGKGGVEEAWKCLRDMERGEW